jgi:5-carboxymethyl-2-hydroxymuconate isomerase
VHVDLLIREGRPLEVRREFTQRNMTVLKQTFGDCFENNHSSLSVDNGEIRQGIALTVHNIPDIIN